MKIKRIEFAHEITDPYMDNLDVFVENENGYTYTIVVSTPGDLLDQMEQEKINFIMPDTPKIIVKKLTEQIVREAIQAYAENDGYWLKLCQFGDDIDNIFELTTVGLPRGMVNRTGFDTQHQLGKDEWSSIVQTELEKDPIFGITLSSNVSNGNGTISITAEALTNINLDKKEKIEDYNIVICLTEKNIVHWQKDNTAGDIEDYEHNHVLRTMINTTFGESIGNSFVDGDIWEKDYSVDITSLEDANENYSLNTLFMGNGNCKGWDENNMEIVVYIYNSDNYEIVQVEQIHLTNH